MSEAITLGGSRILIVDDQFDNIVVAQTVLEFHGAQVHIAGNGQEGLALLDTFAPTAILLDLSMPVMDGWEMLERLRARPDLAGVPVIAVTAHAMHGDRYRVMKAGFDEYIAKPYDIYELVRRVTQAIERKYMELHG